MSFLSQPRLVPFPEVLLRHPPLLQYNKNFTYEGYNDPNKLSRVELHLVGYLLAVVDNAMNQQDVPVNCKTVRYGLQRRELDLASDEAKVNYAFKRLCTVRPSGLPPLLRRWSPQEDEDTDEPIDVVSISTNWLSRRCQLVPIPLPDYNVVTRALYLFLFGWGSERIPFDELCERLDLDLDRESNIKALGSALDNVNKHLDSLEHDTLGRLWFGLHLSGSEVRFFHHELHDLNRLIPGYYRVLMEKQLKGRTPR